MNTINVYLTFDGDCESAFNFYKSVFGGEFESIERFGDMPPQEGVPPVPEEMKNQIMHVSLPVSKETVLMGSDGGGQSGEAYVKGNNFTLNVSADSKEETERVFNALASEGKVTMPLNETFWGSYFGMLTDKFGINWMVNHQLEQK